VSAAPLSARACRCGLTFTPNRPQQRFCSPLCREEERASRNRKGTGWRAVLPDPGLYLRSKPTQCDEPRSVDDVQRRMHCRRYSNCLEHAAARGWAGFDCTRCPIQEAKPLGELAADLPGMADLLRVLDLPSAIRLGKLRDKMATGRRGKR
jgi:hypothetical protein